MNAGMAYKIANDLYYTYEYYDTVAFDFILEAVEYTIKDFQGEVKSLEEIHRHIVKNYI